MAKSLTEKAAEMVTARASEAEMTTDEVSEALNRAFQRLKEKRKSGNKTKKKALPRSSAKPETREDLDKKFETLTWLRENPEKSIKKETIICLECGGRFKTLTVRHLRTHGLDRDGYAEKWNLGDGKRLTSKDYSEQRKKIIAEARAHKGQNGEEAEEMEFAPAPEPADEKPAFKPRVVLRKKGDKKAP